MVFARTRCVLMSSAFSVWITPGIVVTMVEAGTAVGVPAGGTAVVVAGADGAVVAPGAGTSVESGAGVTVIAGGAGTSAVLGASTAVADAGEGVAAATGGGVDVGVVADVGDDIGATVVESGAYTTGGAGGTVSTLGTSCAWGVVLVHPAESAKAIVRPQIAYRLISLSSSLRDHGRHDVRSPPHHDLLTRQIHVRAHHRPRGRQSQQGSMQLDVAHGSDPPRPEHSRRPSSPTPFPEEPSLFPSLMHRRHSSCQLPSSGERPVYCRTPAGASTRGVRSLL